MMTSLTDGQQEPTTLPQLQADVPVATSGVPEECVLSLDPPYSWWVIAGSQRPSRHLCPPTDYVFNWATVANT